MIVDDHKILREGLKSLFESAQGINVVAECEDGDEVLTTLENVKVDVILMDIQLKRVNGIEATRMVIQKNPNVKILAFSMYKEKAVVARIVRAGASGFVVKNTDKDELINAIRTVHRRKTYFSKGLSKQLYVNTSTFKFGEEVMGLNGSFSITAREKAVLKLIGKGLTNLQIGALLNMSHRTAETHRHHLLKKAGVKNSVGLIKFATENALLDQ